MRSDLARAPVNLQPPQRTGLDEYKKTSSGSYTGVTRQPSAGRKPPQGKVVLPEFPRRAAVGSAGSYSSLGDAGRSTSVPRPPSRTGGATQIAASASGGNGRGGSGLSHGPAGAAAAAAVSTASATHTSPRSTAPRAPQPGPSSILDSLATPSVLPGGAARAASLAQRMNGSSVMDYGILAGMNSSSAVRIKRQAGSASVPGDAAPTTAAAGAVVAAATAASGATAPGSPSYSTLTHSADQLRAMYLSGPAAGASAGSPGGIGAAGRRASAERSAAERVLSRTSSFSSQNGGIYSAGPGGPPSPVLGSGLGSSSLGFSAVTTAPPPLAACCSSSSYHSGIDQPSRLATGAVYASQYAHQYGIPASTVYIPNFSQHPPPGGGLYGPGTGGGGAGGAHYVQPPRPASLSVPSGAPLPPVALSPSAAGSPPPVQRSGSSTLPPRPVIGPGGPGGGGGNSSGPAGVAGRSGNGAGSLGPAPAGGQYTTGTTGAAGSSSAAAPSAAAVATPKPVATIAASAVDYHASTQSQCRTQQHAAPTQQSQQQQQYYHHPQQQQQYMQQHTQSQLQRQPHPHAHPHAHPYSPGGTVGLPSGAALDAGGSSYTSIASSNASSGSGSMASAGGAGGGSSSGGGSSTKSSVAVAGTAGISSASTSRTASTISQRSVADALAAHTHVSSAAAQPPPRPGQRTTAAATGGSGGAADVSDHSEVLGGGGALSRLAPQGPVGAVGPGLSTPGREEAVCGPLPDLPLVLAPRDASPGRGCVGLQNLGNTCFMNSILQSLNAVPELVQQFLNPPERHWSSKAVVAPAYSGLVRDMITGSYGGCVNPSAFLRKISKHDTRWGDGRQQDSQEFLNSLLEALQAECNRITAKPTYRELQGKGSEAAQAAEAYEYARSWNDSVVDDIFGGLTQSTIQCHACQRLSHTFEPFLGLAVPIPPAAAASSGSGGDMDAGRGGAGVSVADCLRAFVECEELQGDDSYKCEACKQRQPHSKRMQIFRPPRVLVLTLKRFAQRPAAPGFFSRFRSPAKNNTPVRLEPEPLDLTPYCNPLGLRGLCVRGRGPVAPLYQLVAVSHHSGSLEGGHYTAQARSCLDGQWYNFNDSCVRREPSRPSGSSSSAYVMFYRLAELPPPPPPPATATAALANSSL